MKNWKLLFAVIVVMIAAGGFWACSEDTQGPMAPSMTLPPLAETAPPSANVPAPTIEGSDDGPTACDIIGTKCAQILKKVDGKKVSVFVPDFYEGDGDHVFHLWISGTVNEGKRLGPFPTGEWVELPGEFEPGDYRMKVADEIDKDGDGHADDDLQCDKCFLRFTIEEEKDPECPDNLRISFKFMKEAQNTTVSGIPVVTCLETEKVNYVVSHNMDRIATTVPKPECNPNTPTSEAGLCTFDVKTQTYTEYGSVIGYVTVDGKELQCGTSSDTYTVEGCTPCTACESIKLVVEKREGNMLFVGNPPPNTYYTVGGSLDKHYSEGTYGPFAEECDSDPITIRVNLYDDHCGEAVLCNYWDILFESEPCCEACVDVGDPTAELYNFAPHGTAYKINLKVTSQKLLVKVKASQNGNPLIDYDGTLPHSPFIWELKPVNCEDPIEATIETYDDSCGEPVLCGDGEDTYSPECPGCANVTLETNPCSYHLLGDNEYSVSCEAKATGGTENTFEVDPDPPMGPMDGTFPSGIWEEIDFDPIDCEEQGSVDWEVFDGDELCESETVFWETPECLDPCGQMSHGFQDKGVDCQSGQHHFWAQTNMAGEYCLSGGSAQVSGLALTVGNCILKPINAPVNLTVPADRGLYTVTFIADDVAQCQWDETFTSNECQNGGQGCTPGYWQNHTDSWLLTDYSPHQPVGSVFGAASLYNLHGEALINTLSWGGGPSVAEAARLLLRAGVAAVLNASHPGVVYPKSAGEIRGIVNMVLGSHNRDMILALKDELDGLNNLGCPLN